MKLFPPVRSGYEVGWLVSKTAGSDRQSRADDPRVMTATFFLRAEYRLRHGETPEPVRDRPVVCSGDVLHEDPARGLAYAADYVPHKPAGEWTMIGTAHSAGYGSTDRFGVRVRVGDHAKMIDVVGDRSWLPTLLRWRPGPAAAVGSIALGYDRAWGGPSYAANPLGRGHSGDAMPNLEIPGAWVDSRSSRAAPAGFGPLPAAWPQRRKWMGRYSARWVRDHWPWLPPDFDYRFFMAAPEDQWIDGYFRGDEPLVFEQMHPHHAVYQSRLPGMRARCFVTQRRNAGVNGSVGGELGPECKDAEFREVPLNLDTLGIDLDKENLVLVWRGCLPVASLKLLDIEHVLAFLEPLDSPDVGPAHYRVILENHLASAVDVPLVEAAAVRAQIDAAIAQGAKERAEFDARMADQLAKTEELAAATTERMIADAKAAGMNQHLPGLPAGPNPLASPGEAIDELKAELARLEAITDVDVSRHAEGVRNAIAGMEEVAALAAGVSAELHAREVAIVSQIPAEFLKVRRLAPGIPVDLDAARSLGLAQWDLTGVDFSGLDLTGVNFQGAVLVGATFVSAKLARATFSGANLTNANLTDADLCGATLDDADLTAALVSGTTWAGASLSGTKLSGLLLPGADFSGVSGVRADFSKTVLTSASFLNAVLERADFSAATVERADFSGARLERADFGGARAAGIVMRGAVLINVRAREKADFRCAVATGVMADDSAWGTSTLDGADFRQATLQRAQFSEASLRGAMFDRCNLAHAVFDDADVEGGILTHANLLRATFDRAILTNARLDGSNLFEAGLWDARLEGATHERANVKRTRLAQ